MDFLSDHALPLGGFLFATLAGLAWWADRRRVRRANLDRVGLMPWTGLFFWCLLIAAVLLTGAVELWLGRR